MTTYTNPRTQAVIEDWPSGKLRTRAEFAVMVNTSGKERLERTTVDPKTGRYCATKKMTFANKVRIVDGNDGRLYIITLYIAGSHEHISVYEGTLMSHETLYSDNARYAEVRQLFNVEGGLAVESKESVSEVLQKIQNPKNS